MHRQSSGENNASNDAFWCTMARFGTLAATCSQSTATRARMGDECGPRSPTAALVSGGFTAGIHHSNSTPSGCNRKDGYLAGSSRPLDCEAAQASAGQRRAQRRPGQHSVARGSTFAKASCCPKKLQQRQDHQRAAASHPKRQPQRQHNKNGPRRPQGPAALFETPHF